MFTVHKYMTEDLKLGGSELLVYADIASNINAQCECVRLQQTIAKECGLSLVTVKRTVDSLAAKKLIQIKKMRDGKRVINIMVVPMRFVTIQMDPIFKEAILYYQTKIGITTDMCQKNYTAFQTVQKIPGFQMDLYYAAVKCYRDTIKDTSYYKTHIYTFENFLKVVFKYMPGGIEYEQYKIFYDKIHTKTGGSAYYIELGPEDNSRTSFNYYNSNTVSDEELGHMFDENDI